MAKKIKKSTIIQAQKRKKQILEFYYMISEETDVRELMGLVKSVEETKVDIWPELNLMEVVLESDSLIFQDGRECFEDPLDLEFLEENHIRMVYVVSYEAGDETAAHKVLREIMAVKGGIFCSDTEDFQPMWTAETL